MDPTQSPTQEPVQTPIQIPDFQPKPNYLKIIIFSVLIIITLSLLAYLIFQNQKLQKQVLNPPVSPTIQTPSPTSKPSFSISIPPDETAGWKEYTNLSGYIFKYPKELQLEESKDKIIIRIDPPDIRNIVGICPRYISFSSANSESTTKISQDEYLCVYETKILGKKIFAESQYPKNKKDLIDQILSTFKFISEPSKCLQVANPCNPQSCDYDLSKCTK